MLHAANDSGGDTCKFCAHFRAVCKLNIDFLFLIIIILIHNQRGTRTYNVNSVVRFTNNDSFNESFKRLTNSGLNQSDESFTERVNQSVTESTEFLYNLCYVDNYAQAHIIYPPAYFIILKISTNTTQQLSHRNKSSRLNDHKHLIHE